MHGPRPPPPKPATASGPNNIDNNSNSNNKDKDKDSDTPGALPPRPSLPPVAQVPKQDTDNNSAHVAPSTAEEPGANGGSVGAGEGGGPAAAAADQPSAGDAGGNGPAAAAVNDAIPDPADSVAISFGSVGGAGPLESFLARGEKLPVVLLTCDRHELLGETIKVGGGGGSCRAPSGKV